MSDAAQYIGELVARARKAQAEIEFAEQEKIDEVVKRVASSGARPDFAEDFGKLCAESTAMGYAPYKFAKLQVKIKVLYVT